MEMEKKLNVMFKSTKYSFQGWVNCYEGSKSKLIMTCASHGENIMYLSNVLKGARCQSCAVTGYIPTKTGTLYCLRSECGQFVKIGISNKIEQRFKKLQKSTPFDFNPIELFTHDDGAKARAWEKVFHETFESANLTGFDGCTEWLKWNPEIPLWFKFLT